MTACELCLMRKVDTFDLRLYTGPNDVLPLFPFAKLSGGLKCRQRFGKAASLSPASYFITKRFATPPPSA
jgi:hypothetical protein